MSELNHEKELLNFINSKIKKLPLDYSKVFYLYSKIIKLSLVKTYTSFKSIQYSLDCLNMVSNIFFILLSYTNNSKLTMFLSERAVILFIEYINLSNDLNYYEDINILDVKLFIYKKTIGPIKLNNKSFDQNIKNYNRFVLIYRDIIINIFKQLILEEKNIEYIDVFISDIYKSLGNISYEFYKNDKIDILEDLLYNIDVNNLLKSINITSINLEIYMYLHTNQYQIPKVFDKYKIDNIPDKLCKNIITKIKSQNYYKNIIKSI